MGYISRLDAINEMLLAAGEDLVSDLDEASGIDTSIASFILNQTTNEFQFKGIAGNTYVRKIKPDSDRKIILPQDALGVRLLSIHTSTDSTGGYDGFNIQATIRGEPNGYLYNVTEQTNKWEAGTEYTLEFIQFMRWEDMETSIQRGILASACRWYQMITQGDDAADTYLASKEVYQQSKGKASDILHKGRNIFQGDLGRRALQSRGSITNDPARVRLWNFKHGG